MGIELFPVKAAPEHFGDYYELRCDPNNIIWSGHRSAPEPAKLKEWYLKNIDKEGRIFYLFYNEIEYKICLAYLYMDKNIQVVDIGYGVHSKFNGKGYGTAVIGFAINFIQKELKDIKQVEAWVSEENAGSVKVFLKNGFQRSNETKEVVFETGTKKVFTKYLFLI